MRRVTGREALGLIGAGLPPAADFSQSRQLKANRGHGFSTVLLQFVPKLRYAGVDEATLHMVLVDNPGRFPSFVPPTV